MADGTMVMVDKSEAYRRFRDAAAGEGFAKAPPEDIEVYDEITITSATDVKAQLKFFSGADPNDRTKRSNDPQIVYGQALSNDIVMCVHSVAIEADQLLATTGVQQAALLEQLAECNLEIFGNSDRLFSKRVSYLMTGRPGSSSYVDAGSIAYKDELRRSAPHAFPIPRAIQGGGTMKFDLWTPAAFTGAPTSFKVKLVLGVWVARKGQPAVNNPILNARL